VIVVIIRLARKLYSFPWAVALGLLLGGALGNLTDRIFRAPGVFEGEVVDFIAPKGFAVFNLADSAIVCGGLLGAVLALRGVEFDGTRGRARRRPGGDVGGDTDAGPDRPDGDGTARG
jgi:signal peptidase II